ncbi:hypothetical protein GGS23DRAFT_612448, partial [Durotheca rogersii]|uniref:uncharacterized protein n=1 Tax=Durotheca rogersii TaxID=419775 RepID=UPI00221E6DFA
CIAPCPACPCSSASRPQARSPSQPAPPRPRPRIIPPRRRRPSRPWEPSPSPAPPARPRAPTPGASPRPRRRTASPTTRPRPPSAPSCGRSFAGERARARARASTPDLPVARPTRLLLTVCRRRRGNRSRRRRGLPSLGHEQVERCSAGWAMTTHTLRHGDRAGRGRRCGECVVRFDGWMMVT